MTPRAQWLIVLGVVGLLAAGLVAATLLLGDELFQVEVGSTAPEWRAATIDSVPGERTLADYDGDIVLLNIWATWCGPCEAEMPSMERLHRLYGDSGLRIVAVSVDNPGQEEVVRAFVKRHGLTFDILYDPRKNVAQAYGVTGYPESFVIGRDRVIRRKVYFQEWDSPANRALIRQLLAEGMPDGKPVSSSAADIGSKPLIGR
jgi:peroxiredoxin